MPFGVRAGSPAPNFFVATVWLAYEAPLALRADIAPLCLAQQTVLVFEVAQLYSKALKTVELQPTS